MIAESLSIFFLGALLVDSEGEFSLNAIRAI